MAESTWEEKSFVATFGEMMVYETLKRMNPTHNVERVTDLDEQHLGRDLAEMWTDEAGEHVVFHEVKCEPATLCSLYPSRIWADSLHKQVDQYIQAFRGVLDHPNNDGTGNTFIELCADIPKEGQGVKYVWYDEKTRRGGWNTRKPSKTVPNRTEFDAYGFTADGWYSIIKDHVERGGARPRRYVWFVYPPVNEDLVEVFANMPESEPEGRAILSDSIMLQCPDTYLVKRVEPFLTGKLWANFKGRAKASPRITKNKTVKFSYGYCIPAFTIKYDDGRVYDGLYEVPAQPQNLRFEASTVWGGAKGVVFKDMVTLGRGAGATSECILRKLNYRIKPVSEWFK